MPNNLCNLGWNFNSLWILAISHTKSNQLSKFQRVATNCCEITIYVNGPSVCIYLLKSTCLYIIISNLYNTGYFFHQLFLPLHAGVIKSYTWITHFNIRLYFKNWAHQADNGESTWWIHYYIILIAKSKALCQDTILNILELSYLQCYFIRTSRSLTCASKITINKINVM